MNHIHLQLITKHVKEPGHALSLGYPDVMVPDKQLKQILGFVPKKRHNNRKGKDLPDAEDLFARLSLRLTVIDIMHSEGMEEIYDLTRRDLPARFWHAFDLIIDPGTLEHLQYPGIGLKNVYWMSKPGGFILHHTPFLKYRHGLWALKPKLFEKFYAGNGSQIIYQKVLVGKGGRSEVVEVGKGEQGNLIVFVRRGSNDHPEPIYDSVVYPR